MVGKRLTGTVTFFNPDASIRFCSEFVPWSTTLLRIRPTAESSMEDRLKFIKFSEHLQTTQDKYFFFSRKVLQFNTFHDGGRYHIETSPLICRTNQWTGFYMISASLVKELIHFSVSHDTKTLKLDKLICL